VGGRIRQKEEWTRERGCKKGKGEGIEEGKIETTVEG
jgi:hypothetical protein